MKVVRYLVLFFLAITIVIPFLWMFSTSLKPLSEVYTWPPTLIPNNLRPQNFLEAFERTNFSQVLLNSTIYTAGCILLYIPIASLAAFGFAKYRFKGSSFLFLLVLGAVMIPIEVVVAPLFEMLFKMNLVETFPGMIFPRIVEPFGIFLLRQHFSTIPDDLLDAARIDGCSEIRNTETNNFAFVNPAFDRYGGVHVYLEME